VRLNGLGSRVAMLALAAVSSGCCKPPDSGSTASPSASVSAAATPSSTAPPAASISSPSVKYTDPKALKDLQEQLDGLKGTFESRKPQQKAMLQKVDPTMPVQVHASSLGFLGDPMPLKDCEPDKTWGTVNCYFKVKVIAPNGLGKGTVVNLSCLDADGAELSALDNTLGFGEKAQGDMVRAMFPGTILKDCWEKSGAKIMLKVKQAGANSAAPTPGKPTAKSDDEDKDDTSSSGKTATFPEVVQNFIDMTEVQQKAYAKTFEGTILSGSGELFDVSKCGFTDDSKKYGRSCYRVTLDSGVPRVVLYFSGDDEAKVAKYTKGNTYSFKNCKGISITNWGAWSTATCDTP